MGIKYCLTKFSKLPFRYLFLRMSLLSSVRMIRITSFWLLGELPPNVLAACSTNLISSPLSPKLMLAMMFLISYKAAVRKGCKVRSYFLLMYSRPSELK